VGALLEGIPFKRMGRERVKTEEQTDVEMKNADSKERMAGQHRGEENRL